MDNKRKHKETQTYSDYYNEINSKKPNIGTAATENAFGTSSFNVPNSQGDSLPSIVLNTAYTEQITANVQDARLNDYTVHETNSECSNQSIRSTVSTSVNQQDSEYYWNQDNKGINGIRSKFTTCNDNGFNKYYSNNEVQKTDDFGTTKCIDLFRCSDHEISTISSECSDKSTESTVITSVSQQDNDYNYDWTKDDEKFTINNNMTNCIACEFDDPSENYTNNKVRIANCFNANQCHSMNNSSQCSDDGKNIALSSKNSTPSTILTSVRQQKNGCYVYLTEYDELMNEIRSEVYNIVKPKFTSSEKPLRSFIITSTDQHLNEYNEEYSRQPSTSFEHVNNPEILICTIMQENIFPNNLSDDDESHPKIYTNL